jgi:hypothetical protein
MAYHTLLQRHDGVWGIEFGDRDRETVEAERDDYRDHFIKAKDLKIVTTRTSRSAEIEAIVAKLNGVQAWP